MYTWDYEEIHIGPAETTKFVVVDVIDFPVELVSCDGQYYALYIKDSEDGELWFLIENLPKKLLAGYLKGNNPIGDLFEFGKVSIVKRPYENLGLFLKTDYSLQDFELPDKSIKMEIKDLEVFEDFRLMFDKPFRNLLKLNHLNYKLKKFIEKSLENNAYPSYLIEYEKKCGHKPPAGCMRKVIDKKLKNHLSLFLESVDIESLSLVKLALNVKETDKVEDIEVKADLSIRPKIEEDGKLSFLYNHKEKILLEDKEISINISYKLLLEYKGNVKELKRSLLMAYAKNSGLLIVYPYIRHLSDIIKREAGFIFSPLPHILIK